MYTAVLKILAHLLKTFTTKNDNRADRMFVRHYIGYQTTVFRLMQYPSEFITTNLYFCPTQNDLKIEEKVSVVHFDDNIVVPIH